MLELADGSLMSAFWDRNNDAPEKGPENFIWRSFDGGRTWPEKYRVQVEGVPKGLTYPAFEEVYLWQATSGRVYAYGGCPQGDTSKNIDFDAEVVRWRLPGPEPLRSKNS